MVMVVGPLMACCAYSTWGCLRHGVGSSTQATDDDEDDDEGEEDEDDDEEAAGSDSGQEEADTGGEDVVGAGPSGAGARDPHHPHGVQPAATAATEDSVLSADGAEEVEVEGGSTPRASADADEQRSGHDDDEEAGDEGGVLSPCGLPAGYIASLVHAQYKRGGEARDNGLQHATDSLDHVHVVQSLAQHGKV